MRKHEFHFEFDDSELKEQLEKLGEELNRLREDSINIEVNLDGFLENLDEMLEELDENRIVIGNFDKRIEVFADKNGKVEHRVKIHKDKAKKHKGFSEKLKNELFDDGLIPTPDEFESFTLTDEELFINGKKQSEEMHKKYKDFYEDYFDKTIEGDFKISIKE